MIPYNIEINNLTENLLICRFVLKDSESFLIQGF